MDGRTLFGAVVTVLCTALLIYLLFDDTDTECVYGQYLHAPPFVEESEYYE